MILVAWVGIQVGLYIIQLWTQYLKFQYYKQCIGLPFNFTCKLNLVLAGECPHFLSLFGATIFPPFSYIWAFWFYIGFRVVVGFSRCFGMGTQILLFISKDCHWVHTTCWENVLLHHLVTYVARGSPWVLCKWVGFWYIQTFPYNCGSRFLEPVSL